MNSTGRWLEPFDWDFVTAQNEVCAAKNQLITGRPPMATRNAKHDGTMPGSNP
jgi:hypothetical protein